ncbi:MULTISPECIES: Rne/Rng family ribonuclease [unclassified Streptosporangium]|uniref:Rne/Rng family ribonuclease n=1 Tax=unclassified Streptosporangium TaxID=2632669 RepID=UPI002E291544|nr:MULTISPECIES: Rne/Rng family ribonuclease [unclassified Streptosporangium]
MLDNEPNAGVNTPGGDTTTEETRPPATRRRAASRPAGPPPEPPEPAPVITAPPAPVAENVAPAAPEVESPAGAPEPVVEPAAAAPKRATRRKAAVSDGAVTATRRSRAKKPPAEPVAEPAEPAGPAGPIETGPAPVAETAAPVTASSASPVVPASPVAPAVPDPFAVPEPFGEAEVAPQEAPAAPAKRTRTRKKAVSREVPPVEAEQDAREASPAEAEEIEAELLLDLPADEPLDDEPAGEDIIEERPGLFADPFGLAAQERSEVPSVTFQAPAAVFQPLFQAPDPQRAAQPATRPAPVQPAEPEPEPVETKADRADRAEKAELVEEPEDDDSDGDDDASGRRRRRRRGGRGRGKTRDLDEAEETEAEQDDEEQPEAEQDDDAESGSSRRRRRRRRRGTDEPGDVPDDPPNTVVRIRAPRAGRSTSVDEVQSVRGSTRLEAKKQRRREGRELGRRRPPIITESEFLARRESVERMMVVRRTGGRTQIAVLEDNVLVEHYVNREASQSYVGNVYLGKVQNVLPSMEAAFVDIGKGRNAVLYAGEVNFDTAGLEGQPKRIEVALKSGQSVLVQVTKDPMGHKGARLTSQISLPGRYLVYVPDGSMTGISRKLPDKERTRLKSILKKVMPENAGVIVRTAAEGASEDELARDVARLSAQWENIQRKAKSASAPELLSSEPDLTVRVVRDVFNEDFASLVVAGDVWETVDEYVRYVAPHLADRLSRWEESDDVFAAYRIDEQIAKAMERKVWLPSGGSLVIDRTEAMTVVDVNTGKFTGQGGNLEETVTRNNLEAAEEIVRQLRLRDIGGIIVIDFIDMVLENNRDLVLRRLLECLARDRTKHQVAEVTSLGLVQMTRKRVGQGLLEAFSTVCECCNGRGLHVSAEPVEGKPEPRGTQGKMAVEKAVADKLGKDGNHAVAAGDQSGRDTVTDALDGVQHEDGQAAQASGRGRRRSRKARPAD